MTRRKRTPEKPPLSPSELKALQMDDIKDSIARRDRTAQIRLLAAAKLEESHLALATALLVVRAEVKLGWREFADLIESPVGYAYLFKVASRGVYLKKTTFDLLRGRLLRIANTQLGLRIEIPTWNDPTDTKEGA